MSAFSSSSCPPPSSFCRRRRHRRESSLLFSSFPHRFYDSVYIFIHTHTHTHTHRIDGIDGNICISSAVYRSVPRTGGRTDGRSSTWSPEGRYHGSFLFFTERGGGGLLLLMDNLRLPFVRSSRRRSGERPRPTRFYDSIVFASLCVVVVVVVAVVLIHP